MSALPTPVAPVLCLCGDAVEQLRTLPPACAQTCITSPPYYGLRDYGTAGQIGREDSVEEYVERVVGVMREVRRVLRADGTLWLNLGDSYANDRAAKSDPGPRMEGRANVASVQKNWRASALGLKKKDLIGVPWRVAFALQADGWLLRQDIIWHKPNPMPSSVRDRCTTAHEYLFLLARGPRYYFDAAAIAEPAANTGGGARFGPKRAGGTAAGAQQREYARPEYARRNKRSVWTVVPRPYRAPGGTHFAAFPEKLVEPCVLAGCPVGGLVLDPFAGTGTTLAVAKRLDRLAVGVELNPKYQQMALARCA